jgi:Cytochrome c peroxidase
MRSLTSFTASALPSFLRLLRLFAAIPLLSILALSVLAQVTTQGFLNLPRPEAPGTLLSHPVANGSEPIGRTTSINYLNGWVIVGGEVPGSRLDSDYVLRVYDISDPANPVRRHPSDFGLNYPNNVWIEGNYGWNAHGTAQHNDLLLPGVLRVPSFGGPVQLGGTAGIPSLGQLPLGYNRSAQAGPWLSTLLWYDVQDLPIDISKPYLNASGFTDFQTLATIDHVGAYGGGDWHSMFFGDLLIFARSGVAGADGVVVYRLQYNDFDDPAARSVTPHFVGALPGGFHGYWPNLFSDGTGLYVVGSTTDILDVADITQTTHPALDGSIRMSASLVVPNFTNASYPVYQDQFAFIHNRKIDMTRLIAGDANPVTLTLDEAATGVDTSQISLVLGNLWLTGGYPVPNRHQGMGVWVHQQAPDTTRPRVAFHIPQANRVNYPRHAPLSFLIHEHPRRGGPRNGIDFLVRPVTPGPDGAPDTLGEPVSGFLIHDFSGNLTFTPDAGLAPDTTYQVDFPASDNGTPDNLDDDIGFSDAAGNLIEPYSFRFSTGGGVNAVPPPTFSALTASTHHPAPGAELTVAVSATPGTPGDTLEYRFNFDGTWSEWSDSPAAQHTYATTGRPRVLVQVRDSHGAIITDSLRILVINPPAATAPTQSNTLAIGDDPDGRRLWVVNPDAHTVSVLDAATGEKLAEHATGANSNPRNIARDALGRYWVTCHGTDQIRVLQPDGTTAHTIALPYGAAPFGVAASPDGESLFVTLHGSAQLHRYSAANPAAAPATLATPFPTPRAIAVSGNGSRVLVTRFISPELEAEVGDFAFTSAPSPALSLTRVIRLESANTFDGGDRGAGVPNYLASIAISPDGTRAAVASKQDNTRRGLLFGVGDLTHETTVRSVVSFIDLAVSNAEIRHTRRDFDNSDSPSALAYTPLGDTLLVALQGNNKVAAIDALSLAPRTASQTQGSTETSPAVLTFELSAGLAPQGLLIDAATGRLFTQNFMGRSVTVRDAAPFLAENRTSLPVLATTPTVAVEPLPPEVLLGKQIFYNAADPRMSADSYISCATCHVDGGTDGRVWDFTGRGEGLRRTTDLRGRSGLGHGNVHWSANFDEIQDFEHDIRGPFGGTGFLPLTPQQFAAQHPSPATGKTGLSPELDALAAYVSSLTPATTPRSPARNPDGTLTAAALRGRDVFNAQNCASCHSDPARTDSVAGLVSIPNLHDVGTLSALSGLRLGAPLAGIDTPTLHGLHATRTYLHHGQAETLADVFSYAGGALRLAADAERITPASVAFYADNPAEGGGGFVRGLLGGTAAGIGEGTPTPGVRFTGIDGGASGGPARVSLRYVRNYNNGTALLRINGAEQTINVLRQYPDNGWMTSGWRWITVETTLQPGATNTIEVLRGNGDLQLNALLVANADDLAAAEPHRRVLALPAGDRDDLLAYLRQLDNRDDTGAPLATPAPPAPDAPTIVTPPESQTLAAGNSLLLTVAVGGTGPFTYQWLRDGTTPVGTNSPEFFIPSVSLADAGPYNVRITNIAGETISPVATVVINPALAIATDTLPTFTVGRAYDHALEAIGGIDTRAWSLVSGVLPAGLALSADGRIHGTPTAPARAAFTVRVADSSGSATRALTLDVRPVGGFDTDPDLILHYTFDEGSGSRVWDSSPAGNDHSTLIPNTPAGFPINGTPSWSPTGRYGGAYGSTNLAAGLAPFFPANQSDLDFDPRAQAFTISVWVRTTTTDGYRTILSKNGFADDDWNVQYRLWTTNDPVSNVQGISGNNWSGQLATAPAINDGQWHLLTLVNFLDGATWRARLYYDGGATYTQWSTGNGGQVSRLLAIGDTSNGYNNWAGQLDDLRIYRRALSPAEITALHAASSTPASYDTWLAALPTPLPAGHRSPLADPDNDGLPNLLEYALASDPSAPSVTNYQLHLTDHRLSLTFTRHRPDIDYTVEASGDLVTWTVIATNPVPVGEKATVLDPVPLIDSPRRFLRLRVSER